MEISKHARETVIACGPREGPLFSNPAHRTLYHSTVKMLFTSFARCLQQLAFSGCEEAMDNDETSVSQLIGSPSGYKNKTNKNKGPVSNREWRLCECCAYNVLKNTDTFFSSLRVRSTMSSISHGVDVGAMPLDLVKQHTIYAKYRFTKNRKRPEGARLSRIIYRGG